MPSEDLIGCDRIAHRLADVTGDDRWLQLHASLVAGGKSNLTFELTSAAGSLILRRPPTGPVLPNAHNMDREVQVQAALASSGVPVARIVTSGGPDLIGAPFYVMEKVEGHVVRDTLPEGYAVTPGEKRRLAEALADTLADIHLLDPAEVGLESYGRPDGFVQRQIRRFSQQAARADSRADTTVAALGLALESAVPTSSRGTIVHGDFRLDNCVLDTRDPGTVRAVLDWELSTLGDPMTDVGLLSMYWRESADRPFSMVPSLTREPGFPSRSDLLERYASHSGSSMENVGFYEALAHFKLAVILQGIADRVEAGSMAGQDFGDLADEISSIAEAGHAALRRRAEI